MPTSSVVLLCLLAAVAGALVGWAFGRMVRRRRMYELIDGGGRPLRGGDW